MLKPTARGVIGAGHLKHSARMRRCLQSPPSEATVKLLTRARRHERCGAGHTYPKRKTLSEIASASSAPLWQVLNNLRLLKFAVNCKFGEDFYPADKPAQTTRTRLLARSRQQILSSATCSGTSYHRSCVAAAMTVARS